MTAGDIPPLRRITIQMENAARAREKRDQKIFFFLSIKLPPVKIVAYPVINPSKRIFKIIR